MAEEGKAIALPARRQNAMGRDRRCAQAVAHDFDALGRQAPFDIARLEEFAWADETGQPAKRHA